MGNSYFVYTNGISDNWISSCHISSISFFQPIYSSFQLLFHFDSFNWILFELLIILPLFFRLYGSGTQQKLSRFYTDTRFHLLNFMFLFAMTEVICSLLQLVLPQPAICVTWDGLDYSPYRSQWQTPSFDIAIIAILACIFGHGQVGVWRIASIIVGIFFVFLFVSSIFSGTSTFSRALFSSSIGLWLFYTFRFLPPLFVPISGMLIIIFCSIYFIIYISQHEIYDEDVQSSAIPGIRGCVLLVVNLYLYLRFALRLEKFNWMKTHWGNRDSSDGGTEGVVIPTVLTGAESDAFGTRLRTDILDSAIAFVIILAWNGFVVYYFHHVLFKEA